jgi:hypothetical protein
VGDTRGVARRRGWDTCDGVGTSVVSDDVCWVAWCTLAKMTEKLATVEVPLS